MNKENFKSNFLSGLYDSFIREIDKYVFIDNYCFQKDIVEIYKDKILQLDIQLVNDYKAVNGFELLKDNKYQDIMKKIKTSYNNILNEYKSHNICPFKYDVNIFSHNMKGKSEKYFHKEVLYTKLLSYFFNIEGMGIFLYKSILKLIHIKMYSETEVSAEAEKEIEIHNRKRRIDILIKSNNSCIIEAKTKSLEHDNQLSDYLDYGEENNINNFIYLVVDERSFTKDDRWYNMTWFQLVCALYNGLIDSQKKDTPAGIYLQFFISNILYHLYHVSYYNIEGKVSLSESFHSIRYIIDFINNVGDVEC